LSRLKHVNGVFQSRASRTRFAASIGSRDEHGTSFAASCVHEKMLAKLVFRHATCTCSTARCSRDDNRIPSLGRRLPSLGIEASALLFARTGTAMVIQNEIASKWQCTGKWGQCGNLAAGMLPWGCSIETRQLPSGDSLNMSSSSHSVVSSPAPALPASSKSGNFPTAGKLCPLCI